MRNVFTRLLWLIRNAPALCEAEHEVHQLRWKVSELRDDLRRTSKSAGMAQNAAERAVERSKQAEDYIRAATKEAVDLGCEGDASYIVLVGRYHGRDYVQVSEVTGKEFDEIIHLMRSRPRYVGHARYDTPVPALGEFFSRRL